MARRGVVLAAGLSLTIVAACAGGGQAAPPPPTTPDLTSSTAPETLVRFPEQPDGVRWPTEGWAVAAWPDGR